MQGIDCYFSEPVGNVSQPKNFTRPNDFLLERWTDNATFASDDRFAFQTVSYGPRNCLGKRREKHVIN